MNTTYSYNQFYTTDERARLILIACDAVIVWYDELTKSYQSINHLAALTS